MLDAMWISDAYQRCTQMCKTHRGHVVRADTIHTCKVDVFSCTWIDPPRSIWKLSEFWW